MKPAILLFALAAASCGALTNFDVPLSQKGVLRGTLSHAGAGGFADYPASADVSQKFDNEGVKPSQVKTATLTTASLNVTSPATGNLTYLDSFEIWVESPGVEKKRIVHQDAGFKAVSTTYPLVIDGVDLKPYITASSMTFTPVLKQHGQPMADEQLEVDLNLHVELNL